MNDDQRETTPLEDKLAWLESLSRTHKQNFELLPKKALITESDKKDFILSWFKVTNFYKKVSLAYRYGLVALDDNQRFEIRNSYARDYEDNRMAVLESIYWRDDSSCAYCWRDIPFTKGNIDHVIPRSAWSAEWLWLADDSSNLVAACQDCNREKSNFYRTFKAENRLSHVVFECRLPKRELYEGCWDRKASLGKPVCQKCDDYVYVCCRVHEETQLPACEVEVLKPWFGHD
jgi:hypothetical protein